jgi:hypothetical protein
LASAWLEIVTSGSGQSFLDAAVGGWPATIAM